MCMATAHMKCRYTTHNSVPHTATVEMPFLWHCSTNGKLRILVKAQPAPQAPGHCHQLGLAYSRETWVYPTNALSAMQKTECLGVPFATNSHS